MTLILTGSPTRYGKDRFTDDNGFLATVKAELPPKPRILMISAAPDDRAFTDSVLEGMTLCVRNSGIKPSSITMLDRRNCARAAGLVRKADWIVLCGGHVPTQNKFLHEINLKALLKDFDEVYRAVAWFAHKYGRIDWIESNNEYWLEQDARLRTDFNVNSGIKTDHIEAIKEKSEMKKYYAIGKVPTARQIKAAEGLEAVRAFSHKTGFPIIAKPDNGVGASGTYKLNSEAELKDWFAAHLKKCLSV